MLNMKTDQSRKYLFLIISFICLYLFVVYVAPIGKKLPMVQPLVESIEENNIDAGAIYYTDIEIFSEAEINMQNTIDYTRINRSTKKIDQNRKADPM